MSENRRGLGRGLGALIPTGPAASASRPTDVFFREKPTSDSPAPTQHAVQEGFTGNDASGPGRGASQPAVQTEASDVTVSSPPAAAPRPTDKAEGPGPIAGNDAAHGLAPVPGARFAELPVDRIRPNPRQPRQVFDEDELAELTHSIREIGVLQPVVVRPLAPEVRNGTVEGDRTAPSPAEYELIMGERRWRATRDAGLQSIPAIVKDTHDDDLLRDALLENLHRSELNPLEEAAAYQQLLDDFGCTHEELASRIGRSRPQISNTLRLLKLPPLVQRRVAAGVLSAGHARALLGLGSGAAMERLAQRIVAEGLSVRNVEEIVTVGDEAGQPRRPSPRTGERHPQLEDLAARLSDRFDTRVHIALGKRKGKLTVEFASVDDLDRIIDLLAPGDSPVVAGVPD